MSEHASQHAQEYLQLLQEVGVPVTAEEWVSVHGTPVEEEAAPLLPSRPHHYDEDAVPVFTSSQLAWAAPELFGWQEYRVVEDRETAHPWALDYHQEQYYKTSGTRPIHRYSREARLRWTLWRLLGWAGRLDDEVETRLRAEPGWSSLLYTRNAYYWVHQHLKRWRRPDLYASIPLLIRRLGGPGWLASHAQVTWVLERATYLHHTFNWLRRREELVTRERFPKMVFVCLRLLQEVGAASPYKMLGARGAYKRRELQACLQAWTRAGPYGSLHTPSNGMDEPANPRPAAEPAPATSSGTGGHATGSESLL